MTRKANKLAFDQIKIHDVFEFTRKVTQKEVARFAELSGDLNPIHVDEDFAKATPFGQRIAHGMLLASFFSSLVGMYCPGENSLYLSQSLNFRKPLFLGREVKVRGEVIGKSDSLKLITLRTTIVEGDEVLVFGEAKVKFLEASHAV